MQKFVEQKFIGERAMFGAKDAEFERCGFAAGESPLKHGQNLRLKNALSSGNIRCGTPKTLPWRTDF